MSIKDYKKGLANQAVIESVSMREFESSLKKLEAVNRQWRDCYGNIMDTILQDLSAQEKRDTYGICTPFDISDMNRDDQEFLVSLLDELSDHYRTPKDAIAHEAQDIYLRAVHFHLQILDIQRENTLDNIKNIDSKRAEKAILQCVMEYFFLENYDHSYIQTHSDILNRFDANEDDIKGIQERIDAFCRKVGPAGLSEKYTYKKATAPSQEKTARSYSICIVPDSIGNGKSNVRAENAAKRLKSALENSNNVCHLVPQEAYERGIDKPDDFSILLGKNKMTDEVLNFGNSNVVFDKYGCCITIKKNSNIIVVRNDENIKIDNRDAFIAFFSETCLGSKDTAVNDSQAKRLINRRNNQKREKRSLGESILNMSQHIADRIPDINSGERSIGRILGEAITLAPAILATSALGFVVGVSECAVESIIKNLQDSNFDSAFIGAAQEDILLVKTVEYIISEQLK